MIYKIVTSISFIFRLPSCRPTLSPRHLLVWPCLRFFSLFWPIRRHIRFDAAFSKHGDPLSCSRWGKSAGNWLSKRQMPHSLLTSDMWWLNVSVLDCVTGKTGSKPITDFVVEQTLCMCVCVWERVTVCVCIQSVNSPRIFGKKNDGKS